MCAKNITSAWLGSSPARKGVHVSWLLPQRSVQLHNRTWAVPWRLRRREKSCVQFKTPLQTSAESFFLFPVSVTQKVNCSSVVPLLLWAAKQSSLWTCRVLERLGSTPALAERVKKEEAARCVSSKKKLFLTHQQADKKQPDRVA